MHGTSSTLLGALICVAVAGPLGAQTFGEIAGFVRDASGAIIAGAGIAATNESTNQARSALTNETGGYVIPLLLPGRYRVGASMAGFQSQSIGGLEVGVDSRTRADFELPIGSVEEAVQVVALAPLIQRENASLATVIEERRLADFPLNGRNYLSLVKLSSNVATEMPGSGNRTSRQGGERAEQTIAIAGQRQEFNRFTLDGVENTDLNFNTYLIRPSIDALREVKIQTGVYSAQYGRTTSQIIVGTKSGTNELHGTVFEFHRNENLDAREWRNDGDNNPFVRNQFGFTAGGPLIKNRLFFFSNVELLRDHKTSQWQANVATEAMRTGEFGRQDREIFDPLTRSFEGEANDSAAVSADPFPNQTIPVSRHHPVALTLLDFYPQATRSGDDIFDNYRRNASGEIDTEQYLQRFDFQEGDRSSWFARFSHGNERIADPGAFPTQTSRTETRAYQWTASNTRSFSAATLNEFRVAYNQFQNDRVGHFAYRRDVTSELGIRGLAAPDPSAWGTPQVSLADGLRSFGESTGAPWVNRNHTFQALDNASIVAGAHSIKFGGEFRRDHYNHLAAQIGRGSFAYGGGATANPEARGATGHSFADLLLGANTRAQRVAGFADARLRSNSLALYLQDTWRVSRRLTLDLGLRYEYTPPFHDARRGIINAQVFDMGVGPAGLNPATKTPILTRPGSGDFYEGLDFRFADDIPVQAGDKFMGRSLVANDRNDWAPRVGVAFNPSLRWTLRTGVGLFFSQDIGNARFDMSRGLTGRDTHVADQERPDSELSDPWAFSRQNFTCSGWDGVCIGRPFVLANVFGRRTPYVWQWVFDIQRQLTDSIMLQAGYQGNAGHKLERLRGFNQAVNRTGPADRSSRASRRPWPVYGTVQEVDGVVNSNYHALTLKAESRLSRGATFLVNYTWSKAIDTGSGIRTSGGDRLFPADNYNLGIERGLSQFHIGQRFVASILYEFPVGPGHMLLNGKGVLGKVLGGWQVGGIISLSEGPPRTVGHIGDRNDNGANNYPDATGVSPFLETPTTERFWNIEAFDTTNPELRYREGSVGRSTLRDPGFANWDFSLLKQVQIRETQSLQFRFEAFNFSNHPNWHPPGNNARSARNFGRIFGAKTMRELQLGIKYIF